MKTYFSLRTFMMILLCCLVGISSFAQPVAADAGPDKKICKGSSVGIGGSPTASLGTSPYTYSWSPAFFLSNTTIANPVANPTVTTTYYVLVTDATGDAAIDSMVVRIDSVEYFSAGKDTAICIGGSVRIGDTDNKIASGINYAWAPGGSLSSTTAPRPIASPTVTTTYTLVITSQSCTTKVDYVTVTVFQKPLIDAGPDVTISEGQTVTLHATGSCTNFAWTPAFTLTNANTADPDATPPITTLYYVYGTDDNKGCWVVDSVTVNVIPDDQPVFYNTFTPNNDEDNDFFVIGNLQKFPDNKLEIYNRDGKIVFSANRYLNNWDGKNGGDVLPAATYYYIFYPNNGQKPYHGGVTIIR